MEKIAYHESFHIEYKHTDLLKSGDIILSDTEFIISAITESGNCLLEAFEGGVESLVEFLEPIISDVPLLVLC